jgi:glucose-6-phosphate isomerase
MDELRKWAGIDIHWTSEGMLAFGDDLIVDETLPRPLGRLRSVALDPSACTPEDRIQYWMYNGIVRSPERESVLRTGMRYELTLMFPHAIGIERAKTLGHLHSFPEASRLNYPEVCEVIQGKAYFMFQTIDEPGQEAPYCAVVEAQPGDKVIIPPNLHHLTINAGDEPLLFSDVIPLAVKGIYEPLASLHGAAYLYTLTQGFIPNPRYRKVAALQYERAPAFPQLGLVPERPLYTVFMESPESFAWMTAPNQFISVFPEIWSRIEPYL